MAESLYSEVPGPSETPVANSGSEPSGLNRKYLRLHDLRWLRNLFFSSRRVVQGQYAGRHSSAARGHSVEFNDYRQYMPGDEIGDIDWKIYGRADKLFIKLFEHQSDMTVSLVVDASASMGYTGLTGNYSKYDHACMMAAAVAFLTAKQQDQVAFALAQDGLSVFHRPRQSLGHCVEILKSMEEASPAGQANLGETLRDIANRIGRKGLLIVFSDLLDDMEEIFGALSAFTHRGSEVILFHVLHADELKLPDIHEAIFIDSESQGRISMNVSDVRPAYEKEMSRFLATWSSACKGRGIDYKLVSTAMKYNTALEEYLFQRANMV